MWKRLRGYGSTWVTLVTLIVAGLIIWSSPSFQTCVVSHPPHGFLGTANTYKECVGHFIHENAEAIIAAFTIILAVSTILLWMATHSLYEAGERQLAHAEKQFIATHRPRMTVRFVQGPMRTVPNDGLGAAITFANIGQTEATIIAMGCDLGLRKEDGTWSSSGIDAEPKPITPIRLASGDRHTLEIESKTTDDLDNDIAFIWRLANEPSAVGYNGKPHLDLCLIGEVRYRDGTGVVRHTGFFRVYDTQPRHWIADKDSGGEYED